MQLLLMEDLMTPWHALDLTDKNIQRWEEIQCLKSSNRKYNNANRRREPNGQNN